MFFGIKNNFTELFFYFFEKKHEIPNSYFNKKIKVYGMSKNFSILF